MGSISSVDSNCVDIVLLQLASNRLLTLWAKAGPVRESRRGFIRETYSATGSLKTWEPADKPTNCCCDVRGDLRKGAGIGTWILLAEPTDVDRRRTERTKRVPGWRDKVQVLQIAVFVFFFMFKLRKRRGCGMGPLNFPLTYWNCHWSGTVA